jgi:hypothetical protein
MNEVQNLDGINNQENNVLSQERSTLTTVALISSLIVCCPVTTILGPILGVVALIRLRSRPHLKGKGLAWSSIIVGIIATAVWAVLGMLTFNFITDFVEQTRTVSTETIQAGYDSDYSTFRSYLTKSSSQVSDEEIQIFIETLKERYGNFDSAFFNMQEQEQTEITQTTREAPIPIHFVFETTDATGIIMFEFVPTNDWYEMKIGCIQIEDTKHGDIVFPVDSPCAPPVSSTKPSPTDS